MQISDFIYSFHQDIESLSLNHSIISNMDNKIEKTTKHIFYLKQQLSDRKTHGGKGFRAKQQSLLSQISLACKRLQILKKQHEAIQKEVWIVNPEQQKQLLETVLGWSEEYLKKLNLVFQEEIETVEEFIQKEEGFLKFEIEENIFCLFVQFSDFSQYDFDEWGTTIQVRCISNKSLNDCAGKDTSFINTVPLVWHEKILNCLNEKVKEKLHHQIQEILTRNKRVWKLAYAHSREYYKKLNLSKKRFEILTDQLNYPYKIPRKRFLKGSLDRPFLELSVENELFYLYAQKKTPCCEDTEEASVDTIQVICMSNSSLNTSISGEDTFITTLEPSWHEKILLHLNKAVQKEILQQIHSVIRKSAFILRSVEYYTKKYCEKLSLSYKDLEIIKDHIQWTSGAYSSPLQHAVTDKSFFCILELESKRFGFYVGYMGGEYGEREKLHSVQVVCTTDPSLNNFIAKGTGPINTLPDEWHEKLLLCLTEEIKNSLHEKIAIAAKK